MQKNLDFLRTTAVLLVLFGHLALYNQYNIVYSILAHTGVLLFFAHTSYVLMLSLERLSANNSNFIKNAFIFYIKRIFRIYPLAMISVTIITLLGDPYLLPRAQETAGTFISNIFLIQNLTLHPETYSGLWTLPIELQSYLLLPFCFVLARRSVTRAFILGILSVGAGIFASTMHSDRFSAMLYFPCFAAGIITYSIARHYPELKKIRGTYWAPALLTMTALCVYFFRPGSGNFIAIDWVTTLYIALMIPFFKDMNTSWLSKISYRIATYSYGIYLFHIPIMNYTHNSWPQTIILTGIASITAYYLIESPLIKLGNKITNYKAKSLFSVPAP